MTGTVLPQCPRGAGSAPGSGWKSISGTFCKAQCLRRTHACPPAAVSHPGVGNASFTVSSARAAAFPVVPACSGLMKLFSKWFCLQVGGFTDVEADSMIMREGGGGQIQRSPVTGHTDWRDVAASQGRPGPPPRAEAALGPADAVTGTAASWTLRELVPEVWATQPVVLWQPQGANMGCHSA